jgi:GH18 family chitinase
MEAAIGYEAGAYTSAATANSQSTNSVYIGKDSKSNSNTVDNEIVIGYGTYGQGSNTVTIGNALTTTSYLTPVIVLRNAGTTPTGIEGGIYYNNSTKHFYGYDGTTWKQLDN